MRSFAAHAVAYQKQHFPKVLMHEILNNPPVSWYGTSSAAAQVEDQPVGAIFAGRPNDAGMLTDIGMVKGILQTQTRLGEWKNYLRENPFDIRRAYVASGVAQKLAGMTLLGRPARGRSFRHGGAKPHVPENQQHRAFVDSQP